MESAWYSGQSQDCLMKLSLCDIPDSRLSIFCTTCPLTCAPWEYRKATATKGGLIPELPWNRNHVEPSAKEPEPEPIP